MRNVLIVEDDELMSDLMCEALRGRGISAECVVSDSAAYQRITALPTLDGMVLDINLGADATGYDVARFARQVIPHIAVLYVSGAAPPASFQAFGVPDSVFLSKPFDAEEMVDLIAIKLAAAGR